MLFAKLAMLFDLQARWQFFLVLGALVRDMLAHAALELDQIILRHIVF